MPARGEWVFDPDSGGKKIPLAVQTDIQKRIQRVAEEQFQGRYTRLDIRFRGQFCYLDAFTEPVIRENWPPPDWPETQEEYFERLRRTPVHLCRLRYFGNDEWGFAFSPTVTKDTNSLSSQTASLLESQKMLLSYRLTYI
jgi:hypothetical protein